jgi:hypothetical protein
MSRNIFTEKHKRCLLAGFVVAILFIILLPLIDKLVDWFNCLISGGSLTYYCK